MREKIIPERKISREISAAKYSAIQNYLEFFLAVLFFIILIVTAAAFLFLAPLLITL